MFARSGQQQYWAAAKTEQGKLKLVEGHAWVAGRQMNHNATRIFSGVTVVSMKIS